VWPAALRAARQQARGNSLSFFGIFVSIVVKLLMSVYINS
jgi:hypothetical protein